MADQRLLARSLLSRLPEGERSEAVVEAIRSLKEDPSSAGFAISLLSEHPNSDAKLELLEQLFQFIESGQLDLVESACAQNPNFRSDLLKRAVAVLSQIAHTLAQTKNGEVKVLLSEVLEGTSTGWSRSSSSEPTTTSVTSLLRFAKCADEAEADDETLDSLFRALLFFLGSTDKKTSLSARSTLVSFLSNIRVVQPEHYGLVWSCVKRLLVYSEDSFYPNLGYGLWLRWAAGDEKLLQAWFEPQFWTLLQHGLQHGDTESRKQCLGILRQSVVVASKDTTTRSMVCSKELNSSNPSLIANQYDRYLTVFETIVLGRYYNQVLACEDDLNTLASGTSLVQTKWLYTLLASGLGPKMQDSNRKFIGGWIMGSNFQPEVSQDFVDFFSIEFLHWATQGSLFTTSLRSRDGRLRCGHGDKLSNYIMQLLIRNASNSTIIDKIIDAILDVLTIKRRGNFAYASVFLLDGLSRAFEATNDLAMNTAQLEKIVKLSAWTDLPEVARDYVLIRCLKLHNDISAQLSATGQQTPALKTPLQWHEVQKRCQETATTQERFGEPLASMVFHSSKRDTKEQETTRKINDFKHTLCGNVKGDDFQSQITELLNDVWSDLEYLEYPKRLLMAIPDLVLDARLIGLAIDYEPLAKRIADIIGYLQDMSANKLFMFSPLVVAIRRTILSKPDVVESLQMQDVLIAFAERLPEATIDLQLEDVTSSLIQEISPEMKAFNYCHYYGDRASLGFAALLDLASRLQQTHLRFLKDIVDRLMLRWLNQKTPPPTVSTWKSTVQLQLMLVCAEQIVPSVSSAAIAKLLKDLHYLLSIEPLPRYRYLLSWILVRIYLKRGQEKQSILAELFSVDHHSNPKYLAALMKIAVMLVKADDSNTEFAKQLASACAPLAASSKVVIRHEAQWQIPILMDHAKEKDLKELSEDPAFNALNKYIRSLSRFEDPPLERKLDRFDPINDHTLTVLTEGQWFGLDDIETSFCGRKDFLELYDRDSEASDAPVKLPDACMPLGSAVSAIPKIYSTTNNGNNAGELAPGTAASESRALQTKGTAYLTNALDDSSTESNTGKRLNKDLIVVGSLVDNPYNLGGLSRVSEIFGAGALHLQNQNVVSSRDFIGVAVSSHLHFPICQLSAAALPAFLAQKRDAEGYTIVGIEQTDRSMILGSPGCVLPKKVVLVVGSEKEGIPALILSECDLLVEIPQKGVTRSLNVQTAVGIVLFEYARQHDCVPVTGEN